MKYFLSSILALMLSVVAFASPITQDEAKTIARSFLSDRQHTASRHIVSKHIDKTTDLQTATTGTSEYYAFNCEEGGFVIVAADDASGNSVLGYSDNGYFDLETMPEHVRWWLEQYEHGDYTETRQQSTVSSRRSAVVRHSVEPMIKTEWAQGNPYNLRTPVVSGSHCATGCVATAWAQLLYFHQYPAQATGSHGYYWNNQYLHTEFSTPYDWEHMLTQYGTTATDEERQAVALLMSDIGIASELNYGVDATGGHEYNSLHSLVEHFDYDSAAEIRYRDVFDVVDWKDMLRKNLDKGLPMYYGGFSTDGGHAFICDGYDGEYFHFNFGWGGGYNGYYLFDQLHGNYNSRQCAVFNFQPNKGGRQEHTLTVSSDVQLTRSREVRCGAIYTGLYDSIAFQVGLFFENVSQPDSTPKLMRTYDNSTTSIGLQQFGISPYVLSKSNENGTYKAYYRYRSDSTDTWRDFYYPHGVKQWIMFEVADGKGTVVSEDSIDTSLDFEQDGIHYTLRSEYFGEVVVAKHSYAKTEYFIPGTIQRNGEEYKVAAVADSAFLGCNRVQRIELGEGIEQIGTGAFAQCTRLEQLILPATLNIIENNAFAGDTKLADIRSFASTPPELKGSTVFQRNRLKLMRLWVGCESAEAYKKVNIWNDMQMLTSEYFLSATAEGEGEIVIKSAGCDSMQLIALAADHYRFAGWSNQTDADTLIVILESDTTISALFNPEIYEVRFYADEKLLKTDSVEAYKSAVAPEPPELEGYEFVGWDKDFSSVLEDMEVNAIYEVRSGVEDLFNLSNGEVTVYTIDGRMIRKEVGNLTTGIYILRSGEEARIIVIR